MRQIEPTAGVFHRKSGERPRAAGLQYFARGIAAAYLWLAAGAAGAQAPAAPAIDAVFAGDGALTVTWSAPAGVTGITAYDLRHIPTAADETVDASWTVVPGVRTAEPFHHVLIGLANGVGYDVQARAVTDTAGAWSATATGTPAEPGDKRPTAATVALDVPLGGSIEPPLDVDVFEFTLSRETDLIIRASGPLGNTVGALLDADGEKLAENDDGFLPVGEYQFLIRETLGAGTYYIRVSPRSRTRTGRYSLHVDTVTEPGGTLADALPLRLGAVEGGRIDPSSDVDYFRIDLSKATRVRLRAVSDEVAITGLMYDDGGEPTPTPVYGTTVDTLGPMGFRTNEGLAAGTHYIRVRRSGGAGTGTYAIAVVEDTWLESLLAACPDSVSAVDDPQYGCQWHLRNTGQLGGTPGEDIRVEEVWAAGNLGSGTRVVVVDNGVDRGHRELSSNVGYSYEYLSGAGLSLLGHGTSVTGLIAARDNGIGGRGVAPRATIYDYNLLRAPTDANQADAMARGRRGTAVSNNSWGAPDWPGLDTAPAIWERAITAGIERGYGGKGVFYVWAAGNGGDEGGDSNLDGYANHRGVTAVCAVNDRGLRTYYSEEGANLWVCAPSADDDRPGLFTTTNYNDYRPDFGGTSGAAPIVSGVAALVRSAGDDLTWRDVKLILAASARKNDASDDGWETGALKYRSTTERYHFNRKYGFGVVDAKAAVDLVAAWTNLPREATSTASAAPDLDIPEATEVSGKVAVASAVTVGSNVEFVEFVEVDATFDVPSFRDLLVELVSPSGTVSKLTVPYDDPDYYYWLDGSFRFGSARHLGEDPAGTWTLRMQDEFTGEGTSAGTLKSWSLTVYGHRSTPGAPSAPVATAGRWSLTVAWSPPPVTGASEVTSYDVRTIRSAAADKADRRWTVVEGVGTPGTPSHTVTGLLDGTEYDVQVRGVNVQGAGAWSESATATTLPNRAPVGVGALAGPDLQVGDGPEEVDVSGAFEDPDGDTLTYGASSSAPAVAAADASGSRVRLTPVGPGTATITVTATDIGASNTPATQRFVVRVKGRRGVTVSPDALSVDEGSRVGGYTVVLDSAPAGEVTVTPVVPANRDLSVDPTELTFTTVDWRIPKTVFVEAARDADTAADAPVTISHRVSGADYGSVRASSVQVTIIETDTSTLSADPAEAPESGGALVFEVTLSRSSTSDVTVDYATSDGPGSAGARAGSDYTAASGTLRFAAGSSAARRIVVDVMDDAEDEEEEETFRLTLRNARHASLAGGGSTLQVLGTIRDDDDPAVEVSFGSARYDVSEGAAVEVRVGLSADPERALEIPLVATHQGGATAQDYAGLPASVGFGPGLTRQSFAVLAVDDPEEDAGESVAVGFGELPAGVAGGVGTVLVIGDNDGGERPPRPPGGGRNRAPQAVGTLADLRLEVGESPSVEVSGAFRDRDGDVLTYAAESSAPKVAAVAMSGGVVSVAALSVGAAEVTVTATDAQGSNRSATQTFTVTVSWDADGDGLIGVHTPAQLDALRHDLDGDGEPAAAGAAGYAAAFGATDSETGTGTVSCLAAGGCRGYELGSDLDLDTNGSGGPDAGDAYWHGGSGWLPLGTMPRRSRRRSRATGGSFGVCSCGVATLRACSVRRGRRASSVAWG